MQAFWVGLGTLSTTLLSIVSAALLSRYFDKETYGSYKQILYVYNSLNIFFAAGIPKVFSYFLPKFNLAEGKNIVLRLTYLLGFFGLIFSLSLYLSADLIAQLLNNPKLSDGFRLFAIVPLFVFPTLGLDGILTTYRKTSVLLGYTIFSKLILLACIIIPPIFFNGTLNDVIAGWIVGSALALLVALYMKSLPFKNTQSAQPNLSIHSVISYSVPIVLASIGGMMLRASDQFYISRYFGSEVFAEFSNGFVPLPFIGMVAGSASAVVMPLFSKYYHANHIEKIKALWISTLEKSILLIFPPLIFLICFADQVVVLIYSQTYANSSKYFIIYLVSNFASIIIFSPLLLATGRSKFYSKVHIVFAVISWIATYFIVVLFNSPLLIAAFSRFLYIILVLVILNHSAQILGFEIKELLPIKRIVLTLTHCTLIAICTIYFSKLINASNNFLIIMYGSVFFTFALLVTRNLFSLPYMSALSPILQRVQNYTGIKLS